MLPFEHLEKSNTKDNLWIYILLLVQEKKEIHAWRLRSLITQEFGFQPGLITPYRVLYRLEQEGFVKSKKKERRRIYWVTKKGEKELTKAKNFYRQLLKKLIS